MITNRLIKKIKAILLLVKTKKNKNMIIEKNDWYLASFPRSGNTWIRVMLAKLFFQSPSINSLIDLQKFIPDIHFNEPSIINKIDNKFKIIKTHNSFDNSVKKAIYIYRNPLDVAWSFYGFLKDIKALKSVDIDIFINNFFDGSIPYGRWDTHLINWVENSKINSQILIFSYEEIKRNPEIFLKKVSEAIGVEVNQTDIDKAIKDSTAELVKIITNDEIFYGANIPQFVNTPINGESIEKKAFKEKYFNRFKSEIKIYDFDKNVLKIL